MPFGMSARAGLCAAAILCAATAVSAEPVPRLVRVVGHGEVTAMPDRASVTLGSEVRNSSLSAARAEVSATVDRVLALSRDLQIDPKHVNATQLRVQPEYRWSEKDRQRVMLGYVVTRQIIVELQDLDKLGPLFERAIDAGINQVSGPFLTSSRREELERDAMSRAVADARLDGETLASAAGARLGAVRRLDVSAQGAPVPINGARVAVADAAVAEQASYQPGELKFSATVTVEYDLQP